MLPTTKLLSLLMATNFVSAFILPFDDDFDLLSGDEIFAFEVVDQPPPAERWACDVRAWVRAPDLSPDAVFPADARLAYNGSACTDIVSWEVGLRLKERIVVKRKSDNIEALPVKPTAPLWNETAFRSTSGDFNDVYFVNGGWSLPASQEEYDVQMKVYNEQLRNHSLWDVRGFEAVIFDLQHPLVLSGESTDFDNVQAFAVHVPNTNFPPMDRHPWSTSTRDEYGMVNAETQFEYYQRLGLKNGSFIDLPSGRAGFLPISTIRPSTFLNKRDTSTNLTSPESLRDRAEQEAMSWQSAPGRTPCDKGNVTQFSVQIENKGLHLIQGRNVTIDLTLVRSGNGSAYPDYLDVGLQHTKDYTFLRQTFSDDEKYEKYMDDLLRRRGGLFSPWSHTTSFMLMAKNQAALEADLNRSGRSACYSMPSDGRRPLGSSEVRHEFSSELQDVYQFQIELPIPYNVQLAHNSTFTNLLSALSFKLATERTCDRVIEPKEAISTELDSEWKEYFLPRPETKRNRGGRSQTLNGEIIVDVLSSVVHDGEGTCPTHYTMAHALAPVLSDSMTDEVRFGEVSTEIRSESEKEMRRSRYQPQMPDLQGQFMCNRGGWFNHAASVWQRKERALDNEAKLAEPQLVIQA